MLLGRALLPALISLLAAGCIYSPKFEDCKVRCADDGACPANLGCKDSYCRPPDATGVCTCKPDEERACGGGQGECRAGVQVCTANRTWGVCTGEVAPVVEICDGKDNDCNGSVDDAPSDAPPCQLTRGVCAGKTQQCVDGTYSGACTAADYGPSYQAAETRCDGLDNDCDGFADGQPARDLVPYASAYDFVAFDGGYALAWASDVAGQLRIRARLFNPALVPLGPELALGTATSRVTMQAVAYDRDVYVAWLDEDTQTDGGAAAIWVGSPGTSRRIGGFPMPAVEEATTVAATASGFLAAYGVDGGVHLTEWSKDGGPPATRELALGQVGDPLQVPILGQVEIDEITSVALSNRGSYLAVDLHYLYADAGTGGYVDRIYALDGSRSVDETVIGDAPMVETSRGVVDFYNSSTCTIVFFIPQCTNSYLAIDHDVFDGNSPQQVRVISDPTAISSSWAAAAGDDWIASWTERNALYIGRYDRAASALRSRQVDTDGGFALLTRIANAGGPMSAMVYATNLSTGQLSGVTACAP